MMINCTDFEERLQRRLDGEETSESLAEARHREECRRCRELWSSAEKLIAALNEHVVLVPPPSLSRRIVDSIHRSRRRQIVYRVATVSALAAGVILVVYVGLFRHPGDRTPNGSSNPVVASANPTGNAAEFRANVDGAYGALTGIVNQTAERALEPGRVLLPDRTAVAFLTETAKLQQPQVPSLQGAGQGFAEFAPVARLGRFFNYFAQDIPGMEPKSRSDS
jgi:hypothetical protein